MGLEHLTPEISLLNFTGLYDFDKLKMKRNKEKESLHKNLRTDLPLLAGTVFPAQTRSMCLLTIQGHGSSPASFTELFRAPGVPERCARLLYCTPPPTGLPRILALCKIAAGCSGRTVTVSEGLQSTCLPKDPAGAAPKPPQPY